MCVYIYCFSEGLWSRLTLAGSKLQLLNNYLDSFRVTECFPHQGCYNFKTVAFTVVRNAGLICFQWLFTSLGKERNDSWAVSKTSKRCWYHQQSFDSEPCVFTLLLLNIPKMHGAICTCMSWLQNFSAKLFPLPSWDTRNLIRYTRIP